MANLTTLSYAKTQLGITGTAQDAMIEQLITAVSAQIESYTNRKFINATYTERYDGTGTENLYLDQYPVNTVTSVERNDGELGNPTWVAIPANSYYLDTELGMITKGSLAATWPGDFHRGRGNYRVTYNAGYGATASDMPEDLQAAVATICSVFLNQGSRQGVQRESTGTYSVDYSGLSGAIHELPLVKMTLDLYRRRDV